MKAKFIFVVGLLIAASCFGQKAYMDSIKAYQQKYVKELFPVIKADTAHIKFYPIDPAMNVIAKVELLKNQQPFKLVTSSGKTKEAEKYALLTFKLKGKEYKLFAYQLLMLKSNPATANLLFIPFTDGTNDNGSYHGGRYIDLDLSNIKNGKLAIDFNKAYNPYCAFTTGFNCPIPPKENALSTSIKAGEQYLKDKFQH